MSAPTGEVRSQLPSDPDGPIVDTGLPAGLYQRTATASDSRSRRGGLISGFEPVILVPNPDSVTARLLRAQRHWNHSRITSYTYRANWQWLCVQQYVADVDVQVANGQVTGTAFVDSALSGDMPDSQRFGTVGNLFFHIEDAIARYGRSNLGGV